MPCKCHRVVCEEHAAEFRPFEEPCVGVTIAPPNALNVCWCTRCGNVVYAKTQPHEDPGYCPYCQIEPENKQPAYQQLIYRLDEARQLASVLADIEKNPFIFDDCPIHGPWRVGSRMGGLMRSTCPKCDEEIDKRVHLPPTSPDNPISRGIQFAAEVAHVTAVALEPQPACHRIGIHIVPVGTKKCQLCGKEI